MLADPAPEHVPPLCDEDEFTQLIEEMVADEAPRLFAIVQEYGERVDARVAGWGMSFGDHAVAVTPNGGAMVMRSAESTMRLFRGGPHHTARLCWAGPEPAQHDELPQDELRQHDQ